MVFALTPVNNELVCNLLNGAIPNDLE